MFLNKAFEVLKNAVFSYSQSRKDEKKAASMILRTEKDFQLAKPDFILWPFQAKVKNGSQVACRCCGTLHYDKKVSDFLDKLMAFAYSEAKIKLNCTSFFRCVKHNKEIGGASASPHLNSIGADIYPDDEKMSLSSLFSLAVSSGLFRGVGIYTNGIIHVDIKEREEKKLYWSDVNGVKKYFQDATLCLKDWQKRSGKK